MQYSKYFVKCCILFLKELDWFSAKCTHSHVESTLLALPCYKGAVHSLRELGDLLRSFLYKQKQVVIEMAVGPIMKINHDHTLVAGFATLPRDSCYPRHLVVIYFLNMFKHSHSVYQSTRNFTLISKMYNFVRLFSTIFE